MIKTKEEINLIPNPTLMITSLMDIGRYFFSVVTVFKSIRLQKINNLYVIIIMQRLWE